ncbi:hypothetical protein UA08_09354 [Talaromyces atroroseus]|uniref:Secreted beta-glucosidase sun1 n=1 Tax=Talaromyces atroroseus TaxID=1441469 RepID=A0A1Q5Q658_TALAT|nr:hypothetical protein UA08_09354 [Talaromyces atroroseus]OKL55337.1 hypothetical protein UA08_09354 [Talaromyces atroroseus]
MKLSATIALAAAGSLAAAQGHHHGHQHVHKRDTVATSVVDEVVTVYQLDGTPVPVADVCKGIKDGQYKWAEGNGPSGACVTSTAAPTSTSVAVQAAEFIETSSSSSIVSISSAITTSSTPTSSATPTSSSTTSSSSTSTSTSSTPTSTSTSTSSTPLATSSKTSTSSTSTATGIDASFPDGELSCDTFPSAYGAVALDYHGLGGWSGVQYVTLNSLETLVEEIVTAVSGESCTDGAMCSYQCPDGYLKSQWPSAQGSTGQSVGGITCKNGKLYRTNTDYDTLCIAGVEGVTVKNTMSSLVSVCRTDYPGTESETLPTVVDAGSTVPLANPDGSTYYKWEGKDTSAQYYINPAGKKESVACVWGSSGSDVGNWAPMNLGVGYTDGVTYISIFPNTPTTDATLDYNVRIEGASGSCYWDASSQTYNDDSGTSSTGCTVSISEGGSAQIVFSS